MQTETPASPWQNESLIVVEIVHAQLCALRHNISVPSFQ